MASVKKNKTKKSESGKNSKKTEKKSVKKQKGIFYKILLVLVLVTLVFAVKKFPLKEEEKAFEYGGEAWMVVTYDGVDAYYPRLYFDDELNHELYLTKDPRQNGVRATGEFNLFSKKGYLSLSPEIEECDWEMPRILEELKGFLEYGAELESVDLALNTADAALARDGNFKNYKSCFNSVNTSIVLIEMGNPSVIQEEANNYCYRIKIKNCRDVAPIEKFMTEVIVGKVE